MDVVLVSGADEDGEIVVAVEEGCVAEDFRYSLFDCSRWRWDRLWTPYWLVGFP